MNPRIPAIFAAITIIPALVAAVTWQKDSAPFTFGGTGVKKSVQSVTPQTGFTCRFDNNKGAAILRYSLPPAVKTAKLAIFSISGVLLGTTDVKAGTSTVEWGSTGRFGAGIYVAVLRYGSVERKIQFSTIN